jgi:hypothetical protein
LDLEEESHQGIKCQNWESPKGGHSLKSGMMAQHGIYLCPLLLELSQPPTAGEVMGSIIKPPFWGRDQRVGEAPSGRRTIRINGLGCQCKRSNDIGGSSVELKCRGL